MEELGKSHRTLRAAWHWYRRYAHAVQSQRTWFLLLVDWLFAALASCTTAYACKTAVLDRCERTLGCASSKARHACDPGQTRTHRVKAREEVFRLVGGLLFGCCEFSLFLLRNVALPNAPVRPPRAVWALRARDDLQQQSAREQLNGRYSLVAVAEAVAVLAAPAGAPLTSNLSSSGWGVR